MLEMNHRPFRAIRDKPDFHFRMDGTVRLKVGADFPRQHQTARRVPDLDASPIAFNPACAALEPSTAELRLDDRGYRRLFS